MTAFTAFRAELHDELNISDNEDNLTDFSNISSRDCSSDFSDLGDSCPATSSSQELPKHTPSINAINGSSRLDDSQSDDLDLSDISGSLDSVDFDFEGYSDLDISEDQDGAVNDNNNILNPQIPLTISVKKKEEPSVELANRPQACDHREPQRRQFMQAPQNTAYAC